MRIDLADLSYTIGAHSILDRVTLNIDDGSRAAIVGPSGSGKSSLIRVIAGLAAPSSGTVSLGGRVVTGARSVPAHRRGVAYVPQDGALFPHLTAAANITFGLARTQRHTAQEWAEVVSLDPVLLTRYPHELSGGQQQRVALARALAVKARAIVLDEPFSALDTGLRAEARRSVVRALDRVGATAILVTHDQEEALGFGDRLGVLEAGSLTQYGVPLELYDYPRTARVAAMLGAVIHLGASSNGSMAHTAFGPMPLRHAPGCASSAAGQVSVLLREGQLFYAAGPPNAVAEHAENEGQWNRVTLRPHASRGGALTVRLLRRPGITFDAGDEVCIGVDGSGYVLPVDDAAP